MKKLICILLLFAFGCEPKPTTITEAEVIETVEGFFKALDVENTDPTLMDQYVTQDFIIYEAKQKMTKQEFVDFVSWNATMKETNWELSDFRISIDQNSAHASLLNKGTFITETDSLRIQSNPQWLESAYLVKEGEALKLKFYFSDNISRTSDTTRLAAEK
jgi:hypothetical protein